MKQYTVFAAQKLQDLTSPWVQVETIPVDGTLDAVLYFEGDEKEPSQFSLEHISPLACIIYVGQTPQPWCDIHVDISAGHELAEGLQNAAEIVRQTRALNRPKFEEEKDRLNILGLLSTRDVKLTPVADANLKTMFHYPRLSV